MSNFFVGLAVFLITIIGSLFAIPYFVDWNSYRGVFEDEATRFLGREVRVGGAVNLHLLPVPSFRLERVRIADASSTLREPFFRADSLAFKLSIAPLFRGIIEANEIEFRRPVLRLARDDRGGWNWQSFGQVFANAAYLPSNIALTSLKITDGVLAVHGARGSERLRLDGIDGELSAPAIDGPYRFRGTFGKGGAEREIRIATAKPDAEAGVRFRTSIRLAETGAAYLIDARLLDLMAEPKLDGELSARLPIAGPPRGQSPRLPASAAPEDRDGASGLALDLKGLLRADASGGSLSDVALSFEQGGSPQLIVGEAKASWQDNVELEVDLSSRWLDLDRIAGAADGARPGESLLPFALRAREMLPANARSRVALSVDQANLGGEPISGVHLTVSREKDRLEIEQLRLGMPGGSRAELQGALTGPADAPEFSGRINVRGTSLLRAVGWLSKTPALGDSKGDGAFGVHAELAISGGRAAARDIVGDLFGTPLSGEADWRWQGRPEVSLRLEAPQIDARGLAPAQLSFAEALQAMLAGPWSDWTSTPAAGKRADAAAPDLRLSLDAGRLLTATHTYRDVAVQLRLKSGNLELPLLRLADEGGGLIDFKGTLDNVLTRPRGSLTGVVAAATAQDLDDLAHLVGLPEALRPAAQLAQALAPLRLAGSVQFGARTAGSRDLTLAGEANGATIKVSARLDGASAGWRAGPAEVVATIDAPDARKIAALLSDSGDARTDKGGQVLFKAKGVPAEGLSALLTLSAGDLALDFNGLLTVLETGNKIAGDVHLRAPDGQRLATLAGLSPPLSFAGVGIEGGFTLTADAAATTLERLALNADGSEVRGRIGVSRAGGRRQVDARLNVGQISVRSLLAPLLDRRLAAITGAAEAALAGQQTPWPDEPFDLEALSGIDAHVILGVGRLALSDGLELKEATLDLTLKEGKLDVGRLEGAGLGGRARLAFALDGGGGGAEVKGSLSLLDGGLEASAGVTPGGTAGAAGRVAAELAFSGRGANPRNLISALQGQGRAQLDGTLAGLWPGAISLAAGEVFKNDPERLRSVLKEALARGLNAERLPLPSEIALEIADGQLRSKAIVIDGSGSRATGSAAVNLLTLLFESDWRLEEVPAALGSKPPLPAVLIGYRGPLSVLAKLEPAISTEALERELAVRKMEHDVEELERLRQLDEARRRSEAERLRQEMGNPPPPVPVPLAPGVPTRPATPG
jgi:uncharacterized protein involved in outer membrane biogenesis